MYGSPIIPEEVLKVGTSTEWVCVLPELEIWWPCVGDAAYPPRETTLSTGIVGDPPWPTKLTVAPVCE